MKTQNRRSVGNAVHVVEMRSQRHIVKNQKKRLSKFNIELTFKTYFRIHTVTDFIKYYYSFSKCNCPFQTQK